MSLVVDCMNDAMAMVECLVAPGSGAAPGAGLSTGIVDSCDNYDRKGMVECLTGIGEEPCCFVLGINGCVMLINGQPVTIF